jgi:hypothetical protein
MFHKRPFSIDGPLIYFQSSSVAVAAVTVAIAPLLYLGFSHQHCQRAGPAEPGDFVKEFGGRADTHVLEHLDVHLASIIEMQGEEHGCGPMVLVEQFLEFQHVLA